MDRAGSEQQDREALLALYWSSGGPRWTRNQGWASNDADMGSWHGVTCKNGRVVRLDLNRNGLVGTIPAALGGLANVVYLRMSFNSLTGPIPSTFGNLSRLNYLDIRSNQLTGSLPAELGKLTEVSKVDFSCNLLGGHIPPEVGNMTGLMLCWLEKNHIQGPIPAELANIPQLTDLDLAENRVEGTTAGERAHGVERGGEAAPDRFAKRGGFLESRTTRPFRKERRRGQPSYRREQKK
ncbi:Hypothetical leucine rich repeat protein [Ectocarpus siliculosus]|uniref:Hypothetical leucine rich repeat protein n=1 Tax=Ectocarpus siliculosus TaxID=2880 RepID=D7FQH2_ECTSI|nr:Hypothetical leucine rich repeat protein [Ectocarpus siliculosus]|eukprot:CBJ30567.1 Hypothetical leucine rich repeat protein [Ectocarpus siliculosus]